MAESGNPCDATNAMKTFDGGLHIVTFSVLSAGSQTADKTISVSVTVDGDVTVEAPDFSTWE